MRRVIAALVSTSLVACTTVRPVPLQQADAKPSIYQRQDTLALGDELTVTLKSGEVVKLQVRELQADAIVGLPEGSHLQRRIADDEIDHIERKEVSAAKSFAYVGGGTVLVIGVLGWMMVQAVTSIVPKSKN